MGLGVPHFVCVIVSHFHEGITLSGVEILKCHGVQWCAGNKSIRSSNCSFVVKGHSLLALELVSFVGAGWLFIGTMRFCVMMLV